MHKRSIYTKKAVIYCRVSTDKQAKEGDSLNHQVKLCRSTAEMSGFEIIEIFSETCTGTMTKRPALSLLLEFCKNNSVDAVFVSAIDRISRGGVTPYYEIKGSLEGLGVEVRDVHGIIQKQRNTLESFGVEYSWSRSSPSEISEVINALESNNERKRILTRVISAEIQYSRAGLWMRGAPYGFKNAKTYNDGRKVAILIEDPVESKFIRKMYELRKDEFTSDKRIVEIINAMGYMSRSSISMRTTNKAEFIKTGGKKLTVKQLQKYIQSPLYAGLICEKWTNNEPVKAIFNGLVTIREWNKAQQGNRIIEKENGTYVIKNKAAKSLEVKTLGNPMYPYMKVVRCPICRGSFYGSASTGKLGKKHPAYHCSRNHKLYRIPKEKFDNSVSAFFSTLNYSSQYRELLLSAITLAYKNRGAINAQLISNIQEQKKMLAKDITEATKKILILSNATIIEVVEKEIDAKTKQISILDEEEKTLVAQEIENLDKLLKHVDYFLEHLPEFFTRAKDTESKMQLFNIIFPTLPTYEEIESGTPTMKLCFTKRKVSKTTKSLMVIPRGLEPRLRP